MRILTKYLFFIIIIVSGNLLAQNGENPFELKHRQTATEKKENSVSIDTRVIKTDNPFDVVQQATANATISKAPSIIPKAKKEVADKNYIFWVFFILLTFFTTVVALSRKRLEQSYKAFFNDNYARLLHRANQGNFSLGYFLLYLFFFLNVGIFIFLTANHFGVQLPENYLTIILIFLAVGGVFLFKHGLLYFIQNIFPVAKEIKLYSFTIMIFNIILGIVLLPFNTIIAFASENVVKTTVWIGLGAILVTYIYRSLRSLSIGSRYMVLHSFHFFLYLCIVEILPVIILLKIILLRMN